MRAPYANSAARAARLTALFLAVVLAAACTSLSRAVEKPKVSLQSLKVQEPTTQGATLVFGLMVENPNGIAIEVDEVVYDLEVSGRALTSGKLENGVNIPVRSSALVELRVPVKYTDLVSSLTHLLLNNVSPYRLKGSARIGPFEIPFDKSGEVRLREGA